MKLCAKQVVRFLFLNICQCCCQFILFFKLSVMKMLIIYKNHRQGGHPKHTDTNSQDALFIFTHTPFSHGWIQNHLPIPDKFVWLFTKTHRKKIQLIS